MPLDYSKPLFPNMWRARRDQPLPEYMRQRRDLLTDENVVAIEASCASCGEPIGDSVSAYVSALRAGDVQAAHEAYTRISRYARGLIVTMEMDAGLIPAS